MRIVLALFPSFLLFPLRGAAKRGRLNLPFAPKDAAFLEWSSPFFLF
jgi:hypothetical protein